MRVASGQRFLYRRGGGIYVKKITNSTVLCHFMLLYKVSMNAAFFYTCFNFYMYIMYARVYINNGNIRVCRCW